MKLEFCRQGLEKYSDIKFWEYSSSWRWGVHADRHRYITKIVFTFRSFANAPIIAVFSWWVFWHVKKE